MIKTRSLVLTLCLWMSILVAAHAHPTMAGRLKSFGNGVLVITLDDGTTRTFAATGVTNAGSFRVGSKISVEVIGSLGAKPLKAGKVVAWHNSSQIVAQGAKAPYYTEVGDYASTSGTGGMPAGAPVGQHAPHHTTAAVGHGGHINMPTQDSHSVSTSGPSNSSGHTSNGQPATSTQYMNQGEAMQAPLQQMGMSQYGNSNSSVDPALGMVPAPGMDPSAGMNPYAQAAGMDPSMGMPNNPYGQAGMDPSMGMNPYAQAGMQQNPYSNSNLGTGQSSSLMGIADDDDGDYSASNDMMSIAGHGNGSSGNKISGNLLEVNIEKGYLVIQPFTTPQSQKVLLGVGSSAPPDLLIPGKMVEVIGRATPQGFQATEVRAVSGF